MNLAVKWQIFVSKMASEEYIILIFKGLKTTVKIAVFGLIIGIIIGTLVATVKVAPKYKLIVRILDKICAAYTAFFRGTPMVVQLLFAYYVILPLLGIKGVDAEIVGIITFGLNSGAYVSEIMRGGITSVDKGQFEAARALGLGYGTAMIKIVIPQAIKNIMPTLGNEFITLIKETSVLSFITVTDLFKAFKTIAEANRNYEYLIPYTILGLIYIVLVLIITLLVRIIEKIFAKSDRKAESPKKKAKEKVNS
ncbi:MAG: amino acid ABC transporter permease [Clostridia bacterium]|nr:amino acid ABC transporter permease [Clostridia bacterium]